MWMCLSIHYSKLFITILQIHTIFVKICLRNECFWVHGEWVWARDKQWHEPEAVLGQQFVCSGLQFIPYEPRKKTLIPYIYNASNKDPF